MRLIIIIAILLTIILAGCEESASSFTYEKKVVVSGLLESGRAVDSVKVTYTGEVDRLYTQKEYAISNAVVRIIGVDIPFEDTLVYDPLIPGRYYSKNASKIIQATKTYRLDIKTPDGQSITAVTTVPDTFSMIYSSIPNNSVIRYNTGLPVNFFSWTPSRFHASYLPTISSIDSGAARIIKLFVRDTTGTPPQKIGYRVGLPKEQTYTELPWIVLGYYGFNRFDVFAIDDNYSNFLNQFVTSQGGELKEIRYNVQGGLGFFGSRTLAKGSILTYISP